MLNKTTGRYSFELTDHLGNIRSVIAKNVSSNAVDVLSYTDYYPHGGILPGRNYVSSPAYKMGYQGQEKDGETNFYNFELRQFDPRLGRWFNPDPNGQYYSPYLAMGNNPVSMTDPTGGIDGQFNQDDFEADLSFDYGNDYWFQGQFSQNYQVGGPLGGSVNADGGFYSNDKLNADLNALLSNKPLDEKDLPRDENGNVIVMITLDPITIDGNGQWIYDLHAAVQYSLDLLNQGYVGGGINPELRGRKPGGNVSGSVGVLVLGVQELFSGLDDAAGSALYGSVENYHAVLNNAGDNNPYMYTKDEMGDQAETLINVVTCFFPVGEAVQGLKWGFQGGRTLVNYLTSRIGTRIINLGVGKGKSLFWSGLGKISAGEKIAEVFAKSKGLTTLAMKLESSWAGRLVRKSIEALPANLQNAAWDKLSQRFAQAASGGVNVLHGSQIGIQSTWMRIERGELLKKELELIFHNW